MGRGKSFQFVGTIYLRKVVIHPNMRNKLYLTIW